jgi:hypothetical protein
LWRNGTSENTFCSPPKNNKNQNIFLYFNPSTPSSQKFSEKYVGQRFSISDVLLHPYFNILIVGAKYG